LAKDVAVLKVGCIALLQPQFLDSVVLAALMVRNLLAARMAEAVAAALVQLVVEYLTETVETAA
jgi:hypothetical protein